MCNYVDVLIHLFQPV